MPVLHTAFAQEMLDWGHVHESGLHILLLSPILWSSWLDYLSLQDHTFVLLFKAGFFSLFRRLWASCASWFKRIFLVALCSSWIFFHVIWTKEKIRAQEWGKSVGLALHARIWEQRGQLNPDSKIPPILMILNAWNNWHQKRSAIFLLTMMVF